MSFHSRIFRYDCTTFQDPCESFFALAIAQTEMHNLRRADTLHEVLNLLIFKISSETKKTIIETLVDLFFFELKVESGLIFSKDTNPNTDIRYSGLTVYRYRYHLKFDIAVQ